MTSYFDVLPLHPRPEYLESFTSGSTRNGVAVRDQALEYEWSGIPR